MRMARVLVHLSFAITTHHHDEIGKMLKAERSMVKTERPKTINGCRIDTFRSILEQARFQLLATYQPIFTEIDAIRGLISKYCEAIVVKR